jgi:hypothetical protein
VIRNYVRPHIEQIGKIRIGTRRGLCRSNGSSYSSRERLVNTNISTVDGNKAILITEPRDITKTLNLRVHTTNL